MASIHEKVDLLFKTNPKPDGSEYSYQEVEDGIDHVVSSVAIWKLRTGKIKNPSYRFLEALADFFDVPLEYFSSSEPPSEAYAERLRLAHSLQEAGVSEIALRASELDEAAKKDVLSMIEYARKAQRLNHAEKGQRSKGGESEVAGEDA